MRNAVRLDTSFLITLADPRRDRHAVAKQYFQYFLSSRMPMVISSIVVAEFCVRQPLATLPLEQLILLPFTHEDAEVAGSFDFKTLKGGEKDRQSLKDDLKNHRPRACPKNWLCDYRRCRDPVCVLRSPAKRRPHPPARYQTPDRVLLGAFHSRRAKGLSSGDGRTERISGRAILT